MSVDFDDYYDNYDDYNEDDFEYDSDEFSDFAYRYDASESSMMKDYSDYSFIDDYVSRYLD